MDDCVIKVDHVTVRFNMASEKVDSIKEYFIRLLKHQLMFQEFLPLKDISFEVKKGEAWALMGENGCGKSTLLKTISGILRPYKGSITVQGSIAPLIELGAGFDDDLTARENIYLNGTLLGHSEKFMEQHFDDIVDFAELWDFLDSPIKNFSSGMRARLGFAIATMVQPDILIVDEVLAVGDYKFQKKCRYRMQEMLQNGTTLLFVSHNINDIRELCDHAVLIDKGKVIAKGESKEICDLYEERLKNNFISIDFWEDRYENGGTSGAGSYGRLAQYKADFVNRFVAEKKIKNVIEWGMDDGYQMKLMHIPSYLGYDVSSCLIHRLRDLFCEDETKKFRHYNGKKIGNPETADLCLSMDTIQHSVEEQAFEDYVENMFQAAKRYVIIYGINREVHPTPHIKHRDFQSYIREHYPKWEMVYTEENPYPFDEKDPDHTSDSCFYVFKYVR